MNVLLSLVKRAVCFRSSQSPRLFETARQIGALYLEPRIGGQVTQALVDPFFPLTLFHTHYVGLGKKSRGIAKVGRDLARLSGVYLRLREDIDRYVGNKRATCVDLDGDSFQTVRLDQWCSLCGRCCQLAGTIPDPPEGIRYPGYWYAYIAGDGPILQKFCPFLFELPPQKVFFCSIHNVKPLTCLTYDQGECRRNHPGWAIR
jgi:hypothetical protein